MATPEQVHVWVGLDVGKEEHFGEVLGGERLFARSVVNDQAASKAYWTGPASTASRGW